MPPFKTGLLKRKKNEILPIQDHEELFDNKNEQQELLRGELDVGSDATDSENDAALPEDSDGEIDEVLFDGDADSTLGDEEDDVDDATSEQSSILTDSENGDDTDGLESSEGSTINESENSKVPDNNVDSHDSGTESASVRAALSGRRSDQRNKPTKSKKSINVKKAEKSSVDKLAEKIKETSVHIKPVEEKDEYSSGDTSDEEDRRTTVGAVPSWWYDEYPHVGYDLDGRRIIKPPQRDQIDDFLKRCEDPSFWRTVRDPQTGQDVVLGADELRLLARLRAQRPPTGDDGDQHQPWVEWFTSDVLATPLRAFPDHKRSFLPRDERRHVARLVHALRMGWAKTRQQLAAERKLKKQKKFYDLWGAVTEEERQRGIHRHIPAPRRPPPSHAESYNPPPEYLLDEKEMKEWESLSETPWKRKYTFLPQKYGSLRAVPAFPRFTRERFLRCLDLYLAPRAVSMRLTITPEQLLPALPSPRDLQPFPTGEALRFVGHAAAVRAADFDPSGQYIVSGSDDCTVKVWETSTGRCLRTVTLESGVSAVAWLPSSALSLVAAAAGSRLVLLQAGVGGARAAARTDELLDAGGAEPPPPADARTAAAARWAPVPPELWARGVRGAVDHFRRVTHAAWHARGDYLCVTLADAASRAVVVHQLSRRRSQLPFSRCKGLVQCALFHPHKPQLFVATQRAVRIYDLVKQELVKKLLSGAQWISGMAVHPGGDNLLVSTYDRKCVWFDLELSARPYQALRLHGRAVRAVAFHARYPLFASGGDDPYVVVAHGRVYSDLLQNPLLVPLKQLAAPGPAPRQDAHLHTLALRFHPAQPWLLAAGADGTLRLYS